MVSRSPDIVIIGGGIAGCSLAIVLARAKFDVVVLEHTNDYPDRVRGEFMPPWGVAEFRKLGLLELFTANGGLVMTRSVPYGEALAPTEAEARALDLTQLLPEVPGGLCLGHPAMCELLAKAATASGAQVLRGVDGIEVIAGGKPRVTFADNGEVFALTPSLVVGADGRNSSVRKQLGFVVHADAPHNLIGGMLVGNVPGWSRQVMSLGVEERLHFLIFPQGDDKLRLYACYDFADRARFAGADRQRKVLDAFRLKCLPLAAEITEATVLGPFNSFSNEDTWIDRPYTEGCVLIGDAAGHNDPIIGQGLSIAARDVRLVSEILIAAKDSGRPPDFSPYAEERTERMRRLRIAGRLAAKIRAEFGEEARARRVRVARRMAERQLSPVLASLIGPERLPAEAYSPETIERFIAA